MKASASIEQLDEIIGSLSRLHFRNGDATTAGLLSMVGSGEITSVTGLAISLVRMDRPDAVLTLLRNYSEEMDPEAEDGFGKTFEQLVWENHEQRAGHHKGMYNTIMRLASESKRRKARLATIGDDPVHLERGEKKTART